MSTFSTNDLRSSAKPYQRDKNHTSKWAQGTRVPLRQACHDHENADPTCAICVCRPARKGPTRIGTVKRQHMQEKVERQAFTLARKAFRNDVVDAMDGPLVNVSDTSSEGEEVYDASEAPLPAEADYMYSFDAPVGPRAGRDVLSNAIAQAVCRFENNETEKLVKNEYDVVNEMEMAEGSAALEDDDFELIDHAHLN